MKKLILLTLLALPVFFLSARGFDNRGAGGGYQGGYRGADYERNLPHYNNSAWVDPGFYYGAGGYAAPGYSSDPGQIDDTDALYESYLQSNPPIPAPM